MTLIELMVVLAIAAVLLAVAIPSYRDHVMRAQRADAKAALNRLAQFMERAATANGTYPLDVNVPAAVRSAEGGRYTITLVSLNGLTFTATAVRNANTSQVADRCGDFRIDQAGNRTVLNAAPGLTADDCWNR